jgi:hypothetical protein
MSRFNLHPLIESLKPASSRPPRLPTRQNAPLPDSSAPLLLGPLPTINQLEQEASHLAQWEFERQAEDRRREMDLHEAVTSPTAERDELFGRKLATSAQKATKGGPPEQGGSQPAKKPIVYHSHDVYRLVSASAGRAVARADQLLPLALTQGHRQSRHGDADEGQRLEHQASFVAAAVGISVR